MKNRFLITLLVAIVAIFLGVTITVQKTNGPTIRRLVEQQNQILSLQKKLDAQIAKVLTGEGGKPTEKRLEAVEKKVDALLGIFKQARQPRQQPPSDEYTKVHEFGVGASVIKGPKDAPVTIVEFSDFQCPYCSRFHPVIKEVLEAYPKQVRVLFKHFPLRFHPQARPASKAVLAAGEQGKFWEMVDLVFENNKELSDAKFEEFAKKLRLNVRKFKKAYEDRDGKFEKIIQEDMALGQKVGVRGTPTFFLNGRKTRARDLNSYKREIDAILNKK